MKVRQWLAGKEMVHRVPSGPARSLHIHPAEPDRQPSTAQPQSRTKSMGVAFGTAVTMCASSCSSIRSHSQVRCRWLVASPIMRCSLLAAARLGDCRLGGALTSSVHQP